MRYHLLILLFALTSSILTGQDLYCHDAVNITLTDASYCKAVLLPEYLIENSEEDYQYASVRPNTIPLRTKTVTVTAYINGEWQSCSTEVTAEDKTDALAVCHANTTVTLPSDKCVEDVITPDVIDAGSYGYADREITVFTTSDPTQVNVLLDLLNCAGDSKGLCWGTVTIDDNYHPAISCEPYRVVYLQDPSQLFAHFSKHSFLTAASDNCGITSFAGVYDRLTEFGPRDYSITAGDDFGNLTLCQGIVDIRPEFTKAYCDATAFSLFNRIHEITVSDPVRKETFTNRSHRPYRYHRANRVKLYANQGHAITIVPNKTGFRKLARYAAIYLDADRNGSFGESGEEIFNGRITGPTDVRLIARHRKAGRTLLRVILSASPITDACSQVRDGEIGDIDLELTSGGFRKSLAAAKTKPRVYPNPISRGQTIQIELPRATDKEMTIELRDLFGRVVEQTTTYSASPSLQPPANLEPGVYLLTVSERGKAAVWTKRLVIR